MRRCDVPTAPDANRSKPTIGCDGVCGCRYSAQGRLIERVMLLDAVLDDPTATWLGPAIDKRRHFMRHLESRLETPRVSASDTRNRSQLTSADTIEYRMAPILEHFGAKLLAEIKTADVEDFVANLKEPALLGKHERVPRVRRPATINRYFSLLRHMFNWAIGREYLERSPIRRGTQALIRQEPEDNRRHRRISREEEQRLLDVAPDYLKPMIVTALDAGLRRGEMLALTWPDARATVSARTVADLKVGAPYATGN
jgi:integrase